MVGGFLLRCVTLLSSTHNSDKHEAALVHDGQTQVSWGTMQVYTSKLHLQIYQHAALHTMHLMHTGFSEATARHPTCAMFS